MSAESNTADQTSNGDENSLPVAETMSSAPGIEVIAPLIPSRPKEELGTEGTEGKPTDKKCSIPQPFSVQVVKDCELSRFESRTIYYGKIGVSVAFLALVAACVTAYFIFGQFQEMAAQTDLSSRSARQARIDSKDSSIATAKQLAILQRQLNQQGMAMELDERAWVGVDELVPGEEGFSEDTGFPVTIILRNSGKTPARNILTKTGYQTSDHPIQRPSQEAIASLVYKTAGAIPPQGKHAAKIGGIDTPAPRNPNSLSSRILNGTAILYYFGIVKYESFGEVRTTEFCFYLKNPATKQLVFCDKFNDMN